MVQLLHQADFPQCCVVESVGSLGRLCHLDAFDRNNLIRFPVSRLRTGISKYI
jgi:hypothetical protein